MWGITNRFPSNDLGVIPDTGHVRISCCLRSDESRLCYYERSWYTRTLCVVCLGEFTVDMVFIRTVACQRSHYDAVLKVDSPDTEGLEKRSHR